MRSHLRPGGATAPARADRVHQLSYMGKPRQLPGLFLLARPNRTTQQTKAHNARKGGRVVYVQTSFNLDDIGYSATLPTYRTVLRREHRLSESEDEHLRRCRACAEARPTIDWTVGHHGDRRAVVVDPRGGGRSRWTSGRHRDAGYTCSYREGPLGAELHCAEPARPGRSCPGAAELERSRL